MSFSFMLAPQTSPTLISPYYIPLPSIHPGSQFGEMLPIRLRVVLTYMDAFVVAGLTSAGTLIWAYLMGGRGAFTGQPDTPTSDFIYFEGRGWRGVDVNGFMVHVFYLLFLTNLTYKKSSGKISKQRYRN